jgi:hypothetical protein
LILDRLFLLGWPFFLCLIRRCSVDDRTAATIGMAVFFVLD